MTIALFDFDGTITKKDSLVEFIQYSIGRSKYYFGLFFLSPILIAYKSKFISNSFAKERLIAYFFKGWHIDKFKRVADRYALTQIDKIINKKALEKVEWHKSRGDLVVIVSASIECWLEAWCSERGVLLIGTKLEIRNSILTGKFLTKNCYGEEKVNRIKELYALDRYRDIYVYGDSIGDREMLSLSSKNKNFYKIF